MFCKKFVLRNFAKFTGKRQCQSLFFNKVAVEQLWWLLLNLTILFNEMQPKIKKSFFNISINILIIYKEDKKKFQVATMSLRNRQAYSGNSA